MTKSSIDPACTGQFSSIFLDYIKEKETLTPFYQVFPKIENFKELLERRKFEKKKREILVNVLHAQYGNTGIKDHAKKNLELLLKENTFTVTTGHQLNLFTGPLYFIYKIVSTINLADKLREAYPDYHFVPVYWMATEDHDFEEINHFNLDGRTYCWETGQKGAVGDFSLDGSLKEIVDSIPGMPDFFKKAYTEYDNLADAVRYYVDHLFGNNGLLVVDGNSPELKRSFAPIIRQDMETNISNGLVNENSEKLESLGYKTQVYPREINFFYLEKGLRERIIKNGKGYEVLHTDYKFSKEEMMQLVEKSPEKFSPNVIMRPLYQECILPNLAYLGGPAEVAYWFQLKSVFDHFDVDFPAVLPRNFVLVLQKLIHRKIRKLDLQEKDLFKPFETLKKEYLFRHTERDLTLSKAKKEVENLFENLGTEGSKLDSTLLPAAVAAKSRALKIVEQFAVKMRKAEERNFEMAFRQIAEIKAFVAPSGTPQERKINFLNFYLDDPRFIDHLYACLDPLDFDFILLKPDDNQE